MKKTHTNRPEARIRKEYDFSQGVVGKYAKRYARGTNIVVLDRDVTRAFPDSRSVTDARRRLLKSAKS